VNWLQEDSTAFLFRHAIIPASIGQGKDSYSTQQGFQAAATALEAGANFWNQSRHRKGDMLGK
jgi:hypothetical protein